MQYVNQKLHTARAIKWSITEYDQKVDSSQKEEVSELNN